MKTLKTLAFLLLIGSINLFAQEPMSIRNGCNYDGEEKGAEYYTFDASDEAGKMVHDILQAMGGLNAKSFTIKESNVKNAVATVINGQRFILYNTVFLQQFKGDANTKWAAYTVLAHEIGHHLNNHNFGEKDPQKRKIMELEADRFAGAVCRTLGASLEETTAGINSMNLPGETATHPIKTARVAAVANGWQRQNDLLKSNPVSETRSNPGTQDKPEPNSEPNSIPNIVDARTKFLGVFEGTYHISGKAGEAYDTPGALMVNLNPANPNGFLISSGGDAFRNVEALNAGGNKFVVYLNDSGVIEWGGSGAIFEQQLKATITMKFISSGEVYTYAFDGMWKDDVFSGESNSGSEKNAERPSKVPASKAKGKTPANTTQTKMPVKKE